MSVVRTLSCVAFGALVLAACSKPAPKAAAPAAPAAGATSAPAVEAKEALGPVIPADQLPVIKAGLWETTEATAGKPPRVERRCESGSRMPVTMGQACARRTLHRSPLGTYTFDAQCGSGEMSVHILMTARGDFQSRYSVDFTTALKMAGKPDVVDTAHRESRYLGACPAGMETGG